MAVDGRKITKPVLPKKTVEVQEFGGEVIVRALTLSESIGLSLSSSGEDDDGTARITKMLAICVINDDETPFWSQQDWENYGSTTPGRKVCLYLMGAINELIEGERQMGKKELTEMSG